MARRLSLGHIAIASDTDLNFRCKCMQQRNVLKFELDISMRIEDQE